MFMCPHYLLLTVVRIIESSRISKLKNIRHLNITPITANCVIQTSLEFTFPSIVVQNVKNVSTVNFFKANKIWLSRAYFKMCVECKLVKCICMFIQVAFVCLSVGYFGVHVATSPGAWWRTRRHYPEPAPVQLNMV